MRQRVVIAIALACEPQLLIADEATTALDVTTQAQIMDLLLDLQRELGTALLMISHDLALAASYAEEVLVMYAGRVVERASATDLFDRVRMPYTRALIDAVPRADLEPHVLLPVIGGRPPDLSTVMPGCSFAPRCPDAQQDCRQQAPALEEHEIGHWWACWHPCGQEAPGDSRGDSRHPVTAVTEAGPAPAPGGELLLDVRHLVQEFVLRDYGGVKGGVLQAVSDVSFELRAGETLGIVGETGSGKSTLARSVIQAPAPKQGEVIFQGQDLVGLSPRAMKPVRRDLQMVFQDPFTSLDPKWTVSRIVAEPLTAYGLGSRRERRERVSSLLELVGLDPKGYGRRRPRELSGGPGPAGGDRPGDGARAQADPVR